MKSKLILILFLLTGWQLSSWAQAPLPAQSAPQARDIIRSIANRYAAKKNLAFSVVYRYSTEVRPGEYLDSLKGSFEISGDRYKYSIDSTEFLGTKNLAVILFKSDNLIYLAKPPAAAQSNNPIAMLDSLFWKGDGVDSHVEEAGDQQKIILEFTPGKNVKRVEYRIDKKTGWVTRVLTTMDARQLYDPSVQSKVRGNAYVIVETDLQDYRENAFPDSELDPGHYIKKTVDGYIAQAPYDTYKIFLASPDL